MNSKQGSSIKRRMGDDLKRQILAHNGIIPDTVMRNKPAVLICARCEFVNSVSNKYCFKCGYPLVPSAFEEIKTVEDEKIRSLQEKFGQEMEAVRKEMENKFQHILSRIDIGKLS